MPVSFIRYSIKTSTTKVNHLQFRSVCIVEKMNYEKIINTTSAKLSISDHSFVLHYITTMTHNSPRYYQQ
jgi:hypothetical protein